MAQGRAFRPSKTTWLDRNQIRERLEFNNVILVDDTGIEPAIPTMSILAYAVLRVSRVLTSKGFTLN